MVTVERYDVAAPGPAPGVFCRVPVECSSGTYVRSLAVDLGTRLGGGAHLRNLRRTRVGSFTLDEAVPLEHGLGPGSVLAPVEAVRHLDRVVVTTESAGAVGHGPAARPGAPRSVG